MAYLSNKTNEYTKSNKYIDYINNELDLETCESKLIKIDNSLNLVDVPSIDYLIRDIEGNCNKDTIKVKVLLLKYYIEFEKIQILDSFKNLDLITYYKANFDIESLISTSSALIFKRNEMLQYHKNIELLTLLQSEFKDELNNNHLFDIRIKRLLSLCLYETGKIYDALNIIENCLADAKREKYSSMINLLQEDILIIKIRSRLISNEEFQLEIEKIDNQKSFITKDSIDTNLNDYSLFLMNDWAVQTKKHVGYLSSQKYADSTTNSSIGNILEILNTDTIFSKIKPITAANLKLSISNYCSSFQRPYQADSLISIVIQNIDSLNYKPLLVWPFYELAILNLRYTNSVTFNDSIIDGFSLMKLSNALSRLENNVTILDSLNLNESSFYIQTLQEIAHCYHKIELFDKANESYQNSHNVILNTDYVNTDFHAMHHYNYAGFWYDVNEFHFALANIKEAIRIRNIVHKTKTRSLKNAYKLELDIYEKLNNKSSYDSLYSILKSREMI